jgi:hypothetical protein
MDLAEQFLRWLRKHDTASLSISSLPLNQFPSSRPRWHASRKPGPRHVSTRRSSRTQADCHTAALLS